MIRRLKKYVRRRLMEMEVAGNKKRVRRTVSIEREVTGDEIMNTEND